MSYTFFTVDHLENLWERGGHGYLPPSYLTLTCATEIVEISNAETLSGAFFGNTTIFTVTYQFYVKKQKATLARDNYLPTLSICRCLKSLLHTCSLLHKTQM